jgi:hypothetical protein
VPDPLRPDLVAPCRRPAPFLDLEDVRFLELPLLLPRRTSSAQGAMVVQLGGGLAAMAAVRWGNSGSSEEDEKLELGRRSSRWEPVGFVMGQ